MTTTRKLLTTLALLGTCVGTTLAGTMVPASAATPSLAGQWEFLNALPGHGSKYRLIEKIVVNIVQWPDGELAGTWHQRIAPGWSDNILGNQDGSQLSGFMDFDNSHSFTLDTLAGLNATDFTGTFLSNPPAGISLDGCEPPGLPRTAPYMFLVDNTSGYLFLRPALYHNASIGTLVACQ